MSERKFQAPPPVILAMVMADDVRRDPATGKYWIHGVFDVITGRGFPCQHARVCVYVSLREGRGETPITLRMVDIDEMRPPVFECNELPHFPDPMRQVEMDFTFHRPVFPAPGEYCLQFFAAGELLRELRLQVRQQPALQPAGAANV
ncbi:MAG TPA: hypothetical protein VKA46_16130 [Gemmataceae bacterium]|nr:hypothetical protein [Gemmataceae bacterium]